MSAYDAIKHASLPKLKNAGSIPVIRSTAKTPAQSTAEVVRRQSDGSWKFVIDNPDGTALLHHE